MSAFTVRLPDEMTEKLDDLAKAQDRSRSYLAAKAIEEFLERETWQLSEIKAGLEDAENGDFASSANVTNVLTKYTASRT